MIENEHTPQDATKIDGTPPKASSTPPSNNGQIQLWQFMLELLCKEDEEVKTDQTSPRTDEDEKIDPLKWEGETGEFRVMDPDKLAALWGQRKRKPNMNYDKLTRAIRYYYEKNIITKIPGKRFSYRFDIYSLLAEGYTIPSHIKLPAFLSAYPPSPTFISPSALMTAAAMDQRLWLHAQQGASPSLLHTPVSARASPYGYHSPTWASRASTPSDSFSSGSPSSPSYNSVSPTSIAGHLNSGYYPHQSWTSSPASTYQNSYHQAFLSSGLFQDPQNCYSACANLGNLSTANMANLSRIAGSMSPSATWLSQASSSDFVTRRHIQRYSPY